MGGFLVAAVIVGGFYGLFRYLRKREQEAFKGADLSVLEDYVPSSSDESGNVPLVDVAELKARLSTLPVTAALVDQPVFSGRGSVLDEIHRDVLATLDTLLASRFRVFVEMPLSDFVKLETGDANLSGKSISFLVCHKKDLTVAFGIMMRSAGASELARYNFLEEVFRQLGCPLVTLPMVSGISKEEIRDVLREALAAMRKRG